MATGGDSLVGLSIQYNKQRVTLHVEKNAKVGSVIVKAAQELRIPKENLILLHQGTRLPPDAPVETLCRSTVFFLQKASDLQLKHTSTVQMTLADANNQQRNEKYGFCRVCGYRVVVRPVYKCGSCRKDSFALDGEVDFFDDTSLAKISGVCSGCGNNVKPVVQYLCKACPGTEPNTVPFLRQVRDNIHHLPCMKCGDKEDTVILFNCSSKHSMCLACFATMCTMQLSVNGFKNFPHMGFSISCPGPGDDCSETPITDPHHFYLVDNATEFYESYKTASIDVWNPPGDNFICTNCKVEIDLSCGQEVEVEQPDQPQAAAIPGSAWMFWRKLFKPRPPPPTPKKTRKQASCFRCQRKYCCVCKRQWHEGDCITLTDEEEKEANRFQINPDLAAKSCWPPK